MHLTANAGVAALVGPRVYPVRLPTNVTLPAVSYQRISSTRLHSHQGASGLAHPRLQVDCWGRSYSSARGVATAVRKALDGYRGAFGGGGNQVPIGGVFLDNEMDVPEEIDEDEDDVPLYHIALDFMIWHDEEV